MNEDNSLAPGEIHPASHSAMRYIKDYMERNTGNTLLILESFASMSLCGDRLSQVCLGTLNLIIGNEPVSDRYVLGLAWTLKEMEGSDNETKQNDKTNHARLDERI